MSPDLQLAFNVTIALVIALTGGLLANALRQPPLCGYLLAGIIIGPFTPGFVGNRAQIASIAEVGVIFLMFALGIAFSPGDLKNVRGVAIGGTLIQVVLTILLGTGLGKVLGWPLMQSIFFGGVLVASSSMVILKTLMDRGEVAAPHGRLLLGMSIIQDLMVVVLIVLLPKIAGGSHVNFADLGLLLLKAVLFIGITFGIGIRAVPLLLSYLASLRSTEMFIVASAALALGMALLSAGIGLSAALGAFLAGLMLSETEYDHRVVTDVIPLRDLFSTLFFVSIGMLIDVRFLAAHWPLVLGMALFVMAVKSISTALGMLPFGLGAKTTAFVSLGMIPIGELNYILAHSGRATGALSEEIYNLALTSSLFTIVLTPGAFWIAPRVARGLEAVPLLKRLLTPRAALPENSVAFDSHAIVIGYGRVGKRMMRGLHRAGLEVVVIEQDLHLVREVNEAGTVALYGDASSATVLGAAHPERARLVVVALPDFGDTRAVVHRVRLTNPNVPIVARAQRAQDDVKLREAGATAVVVPELAGSLMLLEEAFLVLDLPHDNIFTGFAPWKRNGIEDDASDDASDVKPKQGEEDDNAQQAPDT